MPQPLIDEVEAFRIARDYVQAHGEGYWSPSYSIQFHDLKYTILTNADALGSNATVVINAQTGNVEDVDWNPM